MIAVLAVDVLPSSTVPFQLAIRQPFAGWAVTCTEAPAVYWPEAQPEERAGEAVGSPPEPVWVRRRL
jgi:hypothetical protein